MSPTFDGPCPLIVVLAVLGGCGAQAPETATLAPASVEPGAAHPRKHRAIAPSSCSIQPTGAILDRWALSGGDHGPLGCPSAEAEESADGSRVQTFGGGQIRTAPAWGPAAAIALYQQGGDLALDWGDTAPKQFDAFSVQWTVDGGPAESRTIPSGLRTRGLWFFPVPRPGTYSVRLGGCNAVDPVDAGECSPGRSAAPRFSCPPSWTAPVVHPFVAQPPAPPAVTVRCTQKFESLSDAITARWLDLQDSLGCPTGPQVRVSGSRSVRQNFAHGQMVWSPEQGAKMVVALYERDGTLVLDWSSSSPYRYDKFLVRNAATGEQSDISSGRPTEGHVEAVSRPTPGRTYSLIVEGCHERTLAPAQCPEEWTTPVSLTYLSPPSQAPAAGPAASLDFRRLQPVVSAAHAGSKRTRRVRGTSSRRAAPTYRRCRILWGSSRTTPALRFRSS